MRWLVLILLLVGCSVQEEDTIDSDCYLYYTSRLGLEYAKEVCK
jgi:hypothetical protein